MKILITGSNGLLGQKLISLINTDESVHLIATALRPLDVSLKNGVFYKMDITNRDQVLNTIELTKPDVVLNAAAMTHVDQCELNQEVCYKTNVSAISNLIEACEQHGSHLVQLSTDFIFDGSYGPLDETAIPDPVNYYGQTKLEAEYKLQQSGISWCIIRTVLVYGITHDMSRSNIVLWVKNNLENKKAIQVVNDQWRTPTLAEDLAQGCYLAATKKVQGIFHISGKDFLTPYDIALQTADVFNLDKGLINATDSSTFKQAAARPLKTGFIIAKARNILGYEPHSFGEGLHVVKKQIESATRQS